MSFTDGIKKIAVAGTKWQWIVRNIKKLKRPTLSKKLKSGFHFTYRIAPNMAVSVKSVVMSIPILTSTMLVGRSWLNVVIMQ